MNTVNRNQKTADGNHGASHTEQKKKELRGAHSEGNANAGQNQNPGKAVPSRHVPPENKGNKEKGKNPDPKETRSAVEGTEDQREDAVLIKEEIRSRDA